MPVVLAGMYGLRMSEIIGLRTTNIDLEKMQFGVVEQMPFKVPPGTKTITEMAQTKSNDRILPITEEALPYFLRQFDLIARQKALTEAGGGVYYDNKLFIAKPDGSPQRRDRMSANFGQLIRHLEMPHIRFHDLRHTAATNMHKALKYAVKLDLIPGNPVDKVERPKLQKYMASYYTAQEMEELFQAARGSRLELIILFAAFYGLRRSEVLGLRWDAIDFEAGTLTIRHIVTSANIEGKHILIQADRAKTSSSLRTLPLVEGFAQRLRALKEQQKYNEKLCGNCYNQKFKGYLFVDEMGNLILPNTVTDNFAQLLKEHGLRKIRFHDLRHSCASLLLKQGVPMKQIQEWLGHSDISTTANIYAHLDSQSKQLSAATMEKALALPEELPESRW